MLLSLPLLISHLFYARAACMRMWALLARGRCEVSSWCLCGPWGPLISGYYVSYMYYDHIVHVKHDLV